MRNALLAAALALGFGFAASGAQAAAVGGNVAAIQTTAAQNGNALVEKAHYEGRYYHRRDYYGPRRHWRRYGYYRRHHHWRPRPFGYSNYYHRRHYRHYGYYR